MCSANDQTIGAVSVDDGQPHPEAGPDWAEDREEERPAAIDEESAPPPAMTGPPVPAAVASQATQGRWSRWAPVVARLMNRRSSRGMPPVAAPLTTRVPSAAVDIPERADTDEPAEQPAQAEQPRYSTPVDHSGEWAWAEPVVYEFPAEPEVPPAVAVTSPMPAAAAPETADESAPVGGTEPADSADAGNEADAKQETAVQEEPESVHTPPQRALDIGLLVLRVAVGAAVLMHGLQKLVGAWDGPGLNGFESILANTPDPSIGFDGSATGWLAPLGAIAETVSGALLVVGLVSPVAAATVLGLMVVGALYKVTLAGGLWYFDDRHGGIEYSLLLICASLVLLLVGPGRLAMDYGGGGRRTRSGGRGHWRYRVSVPRWSSGWCSTGPIRWVRRATRADGIREVPVRRVLAGRIGAALICARLAVASSGGRWPRMPTVISVSGDSDDGNGASPYDEPTGVIPVPEALRPPAARSPGPGPGDRDNFYDRHARPGLRRVDDLDDLDPGEVDTVTPSVRGRRQDPSAPGAPVPPPAADRRWTAPGSGPAPVERLAPVPRPPRQAPVTPEIAEQATPAAAAVPDSEPAVPDGTEATEVIERPVGRAVPQRVGPAKKSRWAAFRSGGGTPGDAPAEPEPGDPDATDAYPSIPSGDADTDPELSAPDGSTGTGPDATTVQAAAHRNPAPVDPVVDQHDDLATLRPTDELTPEPSMAYSAAGPAEPYDLPDAADDEDMAPDPRDTFDPSAADNTAPAEPVTARRGTTDIGLLVLRVAVGAAALAHGLQKLFGWWNGPGLDGFEAFLANSGNPSIGFDGSATGWLSVLGAVSETAGGALLILGLLTPIAASAVLGVMLVAATYKVTLAGGLWYFTGAGVGIEYELTLICAALAILLTGPGRIALDFGRGWTTHPKWGSLGLVVVSVAAAATIWVVFNGTNPLNSSGNPIP